MSEMIERVARAICRSTILGSGLDGETIFDNPDYVIPAQSRADRIPLIRWKLYVEPARAAIEAMREPTKQMLETAQCVTTLTAIQS